MIYNWPVTFLKTVDSTNNYANTLLTKNQAFKECVIATHEQTLGRGQKGNTWTSQSGKNLTFSLLLDTHYLSAAHQFSLSQTIALGIVDFLNQIEIEAQIKWPNDILVDKKKIAGILIENSVMGESLSYSIVGIGINANQTQFDIKEIAPTSIKLLTNEEYNIEKLLEQLLDALFLRIKILKNNKLEELRKEYYENLFLFEQKAIFEDVTGRFEGIIKGVTEFGELKVQKGEQIKKYMMQEIKCIL